MKETGHCYPAMLGGGKAEADIPDCPGRLAQTSRPGYSEDGYYIEVCPRRAWLGKVPDLIDFCGNGADVITAYRDTVPTPEEYDQIVRDAEANYA